MPEPVPGGAAAPSDEPPRDAPQGGPQDTPPGAHLLRLIRDVPDFPVPGVTFRDVTPLLADPAGFRATVDALVALTTPGRIDLVAGVEARGFLLAGPVADRIGAGVVPVRKIGKLPGPSYAAAYDLEYGSATLEMHQDGVRPGQRVLLVDDVLATGGTAEAAAALVTRAGASIDGLVVLIELAALGGRARLRAGRPDIAVQAVLVL